MTQTILSGVIILLIILWIFHYLIGKGKAHDLRLKHAKWLDSQPFGYYAITDFSIRYGNKISYFSDFTPAPVVFKDLMSGDFQETQYCLFSETDGVEAFPTASKMYENYKYSKHVALASITADRNGRVDIENFQPVTTTTPTFVEIGFEAFKEPNTPSLEELKVKYR